MQLSIATRHGHLSEASQDKLKGRVEKLNRYFDRLTAIQITVDLEHRENPTVELKVSVEHSEALVATDQSGDVMSSLDGALHKIEHQIRRHKDKRTERRRPPLKHLEVPVESEPETE